MIVVDASVLIAALASRGSHGITARRRLFEDANLHAPHLIDIEIISAVRQLQVGERIKARRATDALADLSDLALIRHPHWPFTERIWELRSNLTPYDAVYVALAEALGCPFVTGDRRIARAPGIGCAVEVL